MDIAVVGAGASLVLDEDSQTVQSARIALAAVAPKPLLVKIAGDYLIGQQISPETLQRASELAQEAVEPIQDMRGTVEQRRHLVGVLTRRVLQNAVRRAKTKPEF
jgi:carbon-monoxide dehydrogenase medium subunit